MDGLTAGVGTRGGGRPGRAGFGCWPVLALFSTLLVAAACDQGPRALELREDDRAGLLEILVSGREALAFRYGPDLDLPHFWPLNSPSGRNMLVEHPQPYPHHRAFWVADTVRLGSGRGVSTYMAYVTGTKLSEDSYGPPFRDRVRHAAFTRLESLGNRARVDESLVWEMDGNVALLDERRRIVIHALSDGEYLVDLTFTLTASYEEVTFVSDDVHYAWPYLRLRPAFSGENGGIITADDGRTGEKATTMQPALWIDYSNTVDGVTEGVAVFQWPDGLVHRWLTREYGTFGPRRPDERSGKPFILKKGESISQRVAVLVHRGDVETGWVADRYARFIAGAWR